MFQNHHVLPQEFADHPVIRLLGKRFDINGSRNLVTLPSKRPLATELGSSPHTGGHLGAYGEGFLVFLEKLKVSPKFDVADAGDERALDEMASEVNGFVAAAKYAVANGHLFPNTPEGLTTEEGNGENRTWFENRGTYSADHAEKIRQMQETVDQLHDAGWRDAALAFPLLSPTSGLSMAERIEILRRSKKGSPISLQFTGVDPIPDAPGLVPSLIDTRLPGFSPPAPSDLDKNEGFTHGDPRFMSGLPPFSAPAPNEDTLGQLPPTTAAPSNPLVLLSDPITGITNPYYENPLAGGTPVVRNALPWLAGGVAAGVAAPFVPGWLLALGAIFAGTRLANAQEGSSGATMAAATPGGGVLSTGAPAQNTSNNGLGVDNAAGTRGVLAPLNLRPQLGGASSFDPEVPAGTRFGEWVATPAGTMPAKDLPVPPTSAAGSVAPQDVRRLTRVNETNAGNVFTTGSAPVPYLPSTEFEERFGSWTVPAAGGQQPRPSKPIGVFADEPSYLIPPPIFGVDGPVNPHSDGEEWFSRWIRPLLRSE